MRKTSAYIVRALILFAVFAIFTFFVMSFDVKAVGPFFSEVGFAGLNQWALGFFGHSNAWYDVSQILGYLALAVCVCFACVGCYQLFSGRGIKAVDRGIWATGLLYVLLAVFYLFFDKVLVVNFRPVPGEAAVLAPSYPSSHTVLGVCVFLAASDQIGKLVENHVLGTILSILCWLAAVTAVVSRLLSGVHWLTDIIGSLILSAALLCIYIGAAGNKK